jgi:hypothetical protein
MIGNPRVIGRHHHRAVPGQHRRRLRHGMDPLQQGAPGNRQQGLPGRRVEPKRAGTTISARIDLDAKMDIAPTLPKISVPPRFACPPRAPAHRDIDPI